MKNFSHIHTIQDYFNEFFRIRSNKTNEEVSKNLDEYTDCRFIAKIYSKNENNTWDYIDSIVIPTDYYPLSDTSFKVFHCENCQITTNPDIISCFDSVKHVPGHCYSMADELHNRLKDKGFESAIWCGWLFIGNRRPVHHCWVTVGADNVLLDIQDNADHIVSLLQGHSFKNDEELRRFLADTLAAELKQGIKNSVRCSPLGKPSSHTFYVGSRVSNGEAAKKIYQALVQKYPSHPNNRNLSNNGMTQMQKMIFDRM